MYCSKQVINPYIDSKEGAQPPEGRNVTYYFDGHLCTSSIIDRRIERVPLARKWTHGLCYTNKHR